MVKKEIKESEARILVYLSIVDNTRKHVRAISHKLGIGYSYLLGVLQDMTAKGWLIKHPYRRHMRYYLTDKAPLESARNAYNTVTLRQSLLETETLPDPEIEQEKIDGE